MNNIHELKFTNDFVQLVKSNTSESKFKICGFILYTREHYTVVKAMRNDDFINALNKISGNKWYIFLSKPFEKGRYEDYGSSSNSNFIGMVVRIWSEPDNNEKLLEFFNIEDSKELPLFIVFRLREDNSVEQVIWKIDDKSEVSVYNSIKNIVNIVTDTFDNIDQNDNGVMPECVFREIKGNVDSKNLWKNIKKPMSILSDFLIAVLIN